MTTITLQLSERVAQQAAHFAEAHGAPLDQFLLNAIEDYLEDLQDLAYAVESDRQVKAGEVKTYSFQEVMEEFGYTEAQLKAIADDSVSD